MKNLDQLFLAGVIVKSAATAPSSMGGYGAPPPMASMMNSMNTSMMQNPVEAASMNPAGAPGGMLARWAAQSKMPLASMLHNFTTQMNQNKGRAFY